MIRECLAESSIGESTADICKEYDIRNARGGVGKSEKDGKWYGWSHRAVYGFGVGDVVKAGDVLDGPLEIGFKARTDADAEKMARAFAEAVS